MAIWYILWPVGIFYVSLVYFMSIWYIDGHLEYLMAIWYIFWLFGIFPRFGML
jgi:hypothetical protein